MFSRTKIKLSDILRGCLMILVVVRRHFFLFLSQIYSCPIQIHSRWIQILQRQQRSKNPFSYTDDDRRKNTFRRYVFYLKVLYVPILPMNCLKPWWFLNPGLHGSYQSTLKIPYVMTLRLISSSLADFAQQGSTPSSSKSSPVANNLRWLYCVLMGLAT